MVRARSDECGQKRMMNIDDPVGIRLDHLLRNDLHVAGQHDEIDSVLRQQTHLFGFLPLLVLLGDREQVKRNIETAGHMFQIGVVADDQGNLHVPFSGGIPGQHIVQAVRHARNEDRHARFDVRKVEPENHLVLAAVKRLEVVLDLFFGNQKPVQLPGDPHEKHVFRMVDILVQIDDVAFVDRDEVGHLGQNSRLVGTMQQQLRHLALYRHKTFDFLQK